jgi:membrane fusion protein (multidrug efflux system)
MTRSISRLPLLAFALATSSLLAACEVPASNAQGKSPPIDPAVTVKTSAVGTRALPRTLTLTGTLTASRESAVAADVTGKVAETYVERGSRVRAGAPLVRLDRRQAALMEAEAQSQAAVARSQATLASAECARADKLFGEGAINQAEHDRARAQCESAIQSASAATAREQLAGKTIGDLIVKAPFDGVVGDRFVNPGEYVRPDSRVATVVQLGELRLELGVPENALAAFATGTTVRFKVPAYPDETFTGKVRFVGTSVRRATRDLLVEAVVANKDERLRPGMFAVAELQLGQTTLPVVPKSALRSDERAGTDRVFVVADGRLIERLVHKGPASGDSVAIQAGLAAGEQIVIAPAANLRDGLRVQ